MEQLFVLIKDAEEFYERNGRKSEVEDLIRAWACTLELAVGDKAQTAVVWPLFLDEVEYELWQMQGKLKLPGRKVYKMTLDELRAGSDCLAKDIRDVMFGMIEHQLILAGVTEAIEEAPFPFRQALSSRLATTTMRREHLTVWCNAFIPRISHATGLMAEALTNSETKEKCDRAREMWKKLDKQE